MRKLFKLLLFLSLVYIIFQLGFSFFNGGYTINYEINNEKKFLVTETRTLNKKDEIDNYYFEVKVDDLTFAFETYKDLKGIKKVISNIKYYSDNYYTCILPVSKTNTMIEDLICYQGGIYYPYNSIKGNDISLDEFVINLTEYKADSYVENKDALKNDSYITLYDNTNKNIIIGLENYKGVYSVKYYGFKNNSLFNKDIYTKEISGFIKNYYIVADYNEEYEFHEFNVIDLKNNTKSIITSNSPISMYSYINGVVGNSMYLFDISNKKQYEINVKTRTVIEVGNESTGVKKYENGEFTTVSVYDAIEGNLKFDNKTIEFEGNSYARVDYIDGIYYLYEKESNLYRVYRVNSKNKNIKTLLFRTTNIDSVYYNKDEIYFKDGAYIKVYSDLTGAKKILRYNEANFNNNIKFSIYEG